MSGGLRKAADCVNQLFPAHLPRFVYAFAFDQLRDRGPASHRWNAALGAKADVCDALSFEFQGELKDVSAGRIFQFRHGIGSRDSARVSWVLKMVEELDRIHRAIVMRRLHYTQVVKLISRW
jgi:hypothetical protein